jgi:hypothetical protein
MYNRGFDDAQALSSSPDQCTSGKHGHSYLPVAEGWGGLLTPAEPPTPPFSAPPVGRRCASLEVSIELRLAVLCFAGAHARGPL